MILITHIVIALLSMVWTGVTYARPTKTKLKGSYGLVAATLVSGTYLVISSGSPLLEACVTGLLYLGVVFGGIIAAQYRMKSAEERLDI